MINTRDVDEDTVDLQDLQAQIDLSMSFAQNLVTSWVKPTHYSQTTRQMDLENNIKEYMRRPARLGVGAPIPETQSLARGAARLKDKLEGGKKRLRDDEDIGMKVNDSEESRASAIKKKARMNPFGPVPNKKQVGSAGLNRNTGLAIHPVAMKAMAQHRLGMKDTEDLVEVNKMTSGLPVSKKKMKRTKKENSDLNGNDFHAQRTKSPDHIPLSSPRTSVDGVPSPRDAECPTTVEFPNSSAPGLINRQPHSTPAGVPVTTAHHTTFIGFLRHPLLNLDGFRGEASEEGEKIDISKSTPKKKRKRRRKRKSQPNMEVMLTEG